MHHASFVSADFQRSFRAEPLQYCVACHAPLRVASAPSARDLAAGVGCTACHAVPAAHGALGSSKRPRVATVACEGCHDFDVPGTRAILQSTARERKETAFADASCESCHMQPVGGGRRDHRFAVSRDRDLLARALRVSEARIEKDAVVVAVSATGVGHRFPTGDIYRRLTVTVSAYDAKDALVAGETFHMGRDWDGHRLALRNGSAEAMGKDSRLTEVPRELRVPYTKAPVRVHLTVEYERGAGADGESFDAFERFEIFDHDLVLVNARTTMP